MWGCKEHWFKLPKYYRDRIWAEFRPGQETNWTPSREYMKVLAQLDAWFMDNGITKVRAHAEDRPISEDQQA